MCVPRPLPTGPLQVSKLELTLFCNKFTLAKLPFCWLFSIMKSRDV